MAGVRCSRTPARVHTHAGQLCSCMQVHRTHVPCSLDQGGRSACGHGRGRPWCAATAPGACSMRSRSQRHCLFFSSGGRACVMAAGHQEAGHPGPCPLHPPGIKGPGAGLQEEAQHPRAPIMGEGEGETWHQGPGIKGPTPLVLPPTHIPAQSSRTQTPLRPRRSPGPRSCR